MEPIERLEENEIRNFKMLSSADGMGYKAKEAMRAYDSRLVSFHCNDFGAKDTSTAKKAISELNKQMRAIGDVMSDVDFMLDNLIHIMQTAMLDKEDSLAQTIAED